MKKIRDKRRLFVSSVFVESFQVVRLRLMVSGLL